MEQLNRQCDEIVVQTQGLAQAVDDAYRTVPELVVPTDLLVGERIHRLAGGFHEAKEEATRIQLDLNLEIVKL